MKIVYISGTRADYGLMKNTLKLIDNDSYFDLTIIACGMHLMNEFGKSIDEIKNDFSKIFSINQIFEEDTKESMTYFIGNLIVDLIPIIKDIKPDVLLLLGDRAEMLAGAIVANYLQIPIIHIHGGEVSSTVDDSARHAITKLANIHFPATKLSADRIKQMGENPSNIFVTGAPGLDSIVNFKDYDLDKLKIKYGLEKDFVIILQHPVSLEVDDSKRQISETLNAVSKTDYQVIVVYPNSDAGGRAMIEIINEFDFKSYKTIPHDDFIGLLNMASILIGNSSSGIIEAASFNLPVINIGSRQEGREHTTNVIDVDYDENEILKAINKIQSKQFQNQLKDIKNPYGDGKASLNIVKNLKKIDFSDDKLLNKTFYKLE